jgi:hypothetical protein
MSHLFVLACRKSRIKGAVCGHPGRQIFGKLSFRAGISDLADVPS